MIDIHRVLANIRGKLTSRSWQSVDASSKQVRNGNDPVVVLSGIKARQTIPEIFHVAKVLSRDPKLSGHIRQVNNPRSYQDIRCPPFLGQGTLNAELAWTAGVLASERETIESFIALRNTFCTEATIGNYTQCKAVLDQVKEKHGYSSWLLEKEIWLTDRMDGFKRHKQFVSDILQDDKVLGEVRLLTHFHSLATEVNFSYDKLTATINQQMGDQGLDQTVAAYVKFKCMPDATWPANAFVNILMYESISTAIDRYCTFVKIAYSLASTSNREYLNGLQRILMLYKKAVNDDAFDMLLLYLGERSEAAENTNGQLFLRAVDEYTKGEYSTAIALCNSATPCGRAHLEYVHLIARSTACMGLGRGTSLPKSGPDCIRDVFQPVLDGDALVAAETYLKALCVFTSDPQSMVGVGIIHRYARARRKCHFDLSLRGMFASNLPNPMLVLHRASCGDASGVRSRITTCFGESVAINLFHGVAMGHVPVELQKLLPPYRRDKYLALADLAKGKDRLCLTRLQGAESLKPELYQVELRVLEVDQLIRIGKFIEAAECVSRYCVEFPGTSCLYSLSEIIAGLEKSNRDNLGANLAIPVFFEFATKTLGSLEHNYRFESYNDFMSASGVTRPSELPIDGNPLAKLFLRNVCVRPVMELSTAFKSRVDVERERLDICNKLAKEDIGRIGEYKSEITDILYTLMLIEGGRAYGAGKIFVNEDGVRKATEKNISGYFDRLQLFKKAGIQASGETIKIRLKASNGNYADIDMPMDAIDTIESDIIDEIKHNFLFNVEYGLDSYLSGRIRHQILSGAIRGPLEQLKIVTQHDGAGKYDENTHWRNLLQLDGPTWTTLNNAFSEFSSSVDKMIVAMKTHWLRIHIDGLALNPESRLNMTFSVDEMLAARRSVRGADTIDAIYNDLFQVLWCSLNHRLTKIRQEMEDHVTTALISYVDTLGASLPNTGNQVEGRRLKDDLARARVLIRQTMCQIAKWFNRVMSHNIESFSLWSALEFSRATVCRHHPNSPLTITNRVGPNVEINGSLLRPFIDVFVTLFENVAASGKDGIIAIDVKCSEHNVLIISMENSIRDDLIEQSTRRVTGIREKLEAKCGDDVYCTEGGSGMIKIKKTIDVDILDKAGGGDFKFAITGSIFSCEIRLPTKGILVC